MCVCCQQKYGNFRGVPMSGSLEGIAKGCILWHFCPARTLQSLVNLSDLGAGTCAVGPIMVDAHFRSKRRNHKGK